MLLALIASISYYTAVYLTYKVLVWLAYRFLSLVAHKTPFRIALKDTLFRAVLALAVLIPLRGFFHWFASNIILDKVDGWTDSLLWFSVLPVIILAVITFKIIYREFNTLCGLWENDWSWERPHFGLLHMSEENKPERSYGRRSDSGNGSRSSSIFDINCTPSDEDWSRYQQSNYDRLYK